MIEDQLIKAERLNIITQRVGFALWQLQELEGVCAQYYVLIVQAKRGMGVESGQALVDKAQSKTFGSTITQLAKAKQLPQEVESRFKALLGERNWLVHSSRSSSRDAIHKDQICKRLVERIDAIAEEARLLLKEVGKYAELFVKKNGLSTTRIDELATEILRRWHGDAVL